MIEVKVPELAESISEANLLDWQKAVGEGVAEGDLLVNVETDKIVLEVYASAAGALVEIVKQSGESVASGEVIARIDETATVAVAAEEAAEPKTVSPTQAAPAVGVAPAMSVTPAVGVAPSAKKIAAESGVDLSAVSGSGKGGRITKGDVLAAAQKADASPQSPPSPSSIPQPILSSARAERRVPMTRLRARIAERLLQSQRESAILTTFNEASMQAVIDLRAKYKDRFEKEHGARLGFMSFFVKAAVQGLKKFPAVNASVDGGDIVYHEFYDIGVAVASPRGLVVPIVRDADRLSFADIERAIADFGARAQEGKLGMEEITGGTFSISNGGVFGSMLSTPIINPPQSAILGVHATRERAVVENGEVVIRPMNYLALSYDHRIIDGREAVLFLIAVKEALEDPARLALEI